MVTLKGGTTLYSMMNSTTKSLSEVLLSSAHMNGHTLGFHPQTQKLEPPCTA